MKATFHLRSDHNDESKRPAKKVVISSSPAGDSPGSGLAIHPEGTRTHDGDYPPIYLEFRSGIPFLLVWADANDDDVTHVIDLSRAMASPADEGFIGNSLNG